MKKLVILDRDGVINYDSVDFIKSPAEWHAIPGSLEAIALLNQAQILVAVASNQSGIARGYFTLDTLEKIHQKMSQELREHNAHIDKIFYCPHGPQDRCTCRKPQPGLLQQALTYFSIKAADAYFVGDAITDQQAALAAGCTPILLGSGKTKKTQPTDCATLLEWVQALLEKKERK